jgi:ABC-type Fe3+/spermidine/putrescine transport system ATPase subunit
MSIDATAGEGRRPTVRIRNLVKSFRRQGKNAELITPVDNVSLDVEGDELVVLLGPSGCGKTTLLRCVAGLERPDSGEIEIDGTVVFSSDRGIFMPPEKRGINMIFQSYALWPHMSVFDNVAYPLRSIGTPSDQVRQRVMEVLDVVGLGGLDRQYPAQISGGQQQRVALARAIVARDPVILFDEPLSNVDAKVREQLRSELLSLKKRVRFAALYVTHDQHEAMTLGDRIAVLDNGRVAQYDTPPAIYGHPSNRYVGNFVGAANILPGKVSGIDADGLTADTPLGPMRVALPAHRAVRAGDSLDLLTRPETWRLTAGREAGANGWPVELTDVVFSGPFTECVVNHNGTAIRIWTVRPPLGGETRSGWAAIDPSDIHILSPEDGR